MFYICLWVSISILSQIISAQSSSNYDWVNNGFFIGRDYLENVFLGNDSKGNLINAGSYAGVSDYLYILKISPSGDLVWKRDNSTSERHEGKILDLIVDEEDNIFIAGYYYTAFQLTEIDTLFIKKISSVNDSSQVEWEYKYLMGDAVNIDFQKEDIRFVKNNSDIVLTGVKLNNGSYADIVIIKLDINGNELWKKYYSNGVNSDIFSKDIAVDSSGNIYVLASSINNDGSSKVMLLKYNSNGDLIWDKAIKNSTQPNIEAVNIKLYNDSEWISLKMDNKIFILGFDSLGNKTIETFRTTTATNLGLSIDKAGNIYEISTDIIFKNNPEGINMSSIDLSKFNGVTFSNYFIDKDNNIYLVGKLEQFYIVKLNQNLEILSAFETSFQDPLNEHYESSVPYGITASSEFGLFISGELSIWDSLNFNSYKEQVSVKYSQLPTDVEKIYEIPSNYSLSQNYPNPFNPATRIKYTIPQNTHPSIPSREGKERSDRLVRHLLGGGVLVTLKVYDVLGKEVATLVNKEQSAGSYEVEFRADGLTSGVYFYRLQINPSSSSGQGFVKTKKLLLLI